MHVCLLSMYIQNNKLISKHSEMKKKLPIHWSSKIPKRYNRNAINDDLSRAARIASTFTLGDTDN